MITSLQFDTLNLPLIVHIASHVDCATNGIGIGSDLYASMYVRFHAGLFPL